MTDEKFDKLKFYNSMQLDFVDSRIKNIDGDFGVRIPCQLISVDFDNKIVKLWVLPNEYYKEEYIICNHSFIEVPYKKLRIIS